MNDFPSCVNFVIDRLEGGGKIITDRGGATRWGISGKAHPSLDVPSLTRDEAVDIYRTQYWVATGCDAIEPPLNLVVFDAAVNQGTGTAHTLRRYALNYTEALLERAWQYLILANRDHDAPLRGWMNRLRVVYDECQRRVGQ